MTDHYVRYAAADGAATLTVDSPHNRNALSRGLVASLHEGLRAAAADPAVRAVVLTHAGGTFCAGADLAEASDAGSAGPASALVDLLRAIVALPKPVLGRIDGHVRAGGLGLVAACDIAIAGPTSTFAFTEARLGLAASIISLTVLPRLTSRAASRYLLTGEKFGAAEAERIGLVTIAADDSRAATATQLQEMRRCSPQGLAESKALVTASMLAGFDANADRLAATSTRLFGTEEAREGMLAFLERRPPRWAGQTA